MTDIHDAREALVTLPRRRWDTITEYSSLLILPANTIHDSGWRNITVIGCNNMELIEIITQSSDDLKFEGQPFSIDCEPNSGAFHLWGRHISFIVPAALSSLYIEVKRNIE